MSNRATDGLSHRERKKAQLISGIKQAVADLVLVAGQTTRTKNSDYLSRRLDYDYTYLANLFSENTGSTIEQYIIEFKINRVKELLLAGELNLTQISYQLNYSSVAHLSNQFKKVTGLTPSLFKLLDGRLTIEPESVNDVNVFCNRVNALEVRRVSFAT
ncbi:hypothetical protein GCM10028824_26800 [Hymenobacter segetis]|uniref:AraC family transcriptional regulator n=1 Tax=Hymenobacter segetis TaxID=2025509 RepID=A0ABU9LVQ9_9BACT